MNCQPSIRIGVPTYNPDSRIEACLASIATLTEYDGEFHLSLLDDGSPSPTAREYARRVAEKWDTRFVQHEVNRGIPSAWNTLTGSGDEDIIVLLNDDIEVLDKHWLNVAVDFLMTNTRAGLKVGPVGWPTINRDPNTGMIYFDESDTWPVPALVGAPCGCCFLFTRSLFDEIGGFWEELVSFYEEIDFGFQAAKRGYFPIQLGNPSMAHNHSITFAKNPELQIIDLEEDLRRDTMNSGLTHERYEECVRASRAGAGDPPGDFEVWVKERLAGRMGRARAMFARKYGCKDMIDRPQEQVHEKLILPLDEEWKAFPIQWLESDGSHLGRRKKQSEEDI